jgi:hypothetical protein
VGEDRAELRLKLVMKEQRTSFDPAIPWCPGDPETFLLKRKSSSFILEK